MDVVSRRKGKIQVSLDRHKKTKSLLDISDTGRLVALVSRRHEEKKMILEAEMTIEVFRYVGTEA